MFFILVQIKTNGLHECCVSVTATVFPLFNGKTKVAPNCETVGIRISPIPLVHARGDSHAPVCLCKGKSSYQSIAGAPCWSYCSRAPELPFTLQLVQFFNLFGYQCPDAFLTKIQLIPVHGQQKIIATYGDVTGKCTQLQL